MAEGLDLGKQVGPLPLGAWIAVVAGGLGIALWTRNKGQEPEIVEDVSGDPGVGEGGSGQWVNVGPPAGGTGGGSAVYTTNEAWGAAAITWLIAQGYDPGISSSAITKALNGGVDINGVKMSVKEWALWTTALLHFGSPPSPVNVAPPKSVPGPVTPKPDPVTPTPTTPKPPATGSGKVPAHWVYISKSGDTLSGIGKKYNRSWQTIYNFNLKYRNKAAVALIRARGPNRIFAGSTWWIPK